MPNFLTNTIITEYGINRFNNFIVTKVNNFNFTKIKLGDGKGYSPILDTSLTDLTNPVYSIDIIDKALENNTATLIINIPEGIQDFRIKEIGLYETVNGLDYLFAIASVNTYKPKELDFSLTIQIRFDLSIVNFYPFELDLIVVDEPYATVNELEALKWSWLYAETALYEATEKNAIEIGLDKIESTYEKEISLEQKLENFYNTKHALSIATKIPTNTLANIFFNNKTDKIRYSRRDFSGLDNNLIREEKAFFTQLDTIFIYETGFSICVNIKLNDLTDKRILCKETYSLKYFGFYLEDDSLKFTLYNPAGSLTLQYNIDIKLLSTLLDSFNSYIITYSTEEGLKLYINNILIDTLLINDNFIELDSSVKYLPLTNYTRDISGNMILLSNCDYKSITVFDKILDINERQFISSIDNVL